MAFYTQTPTMIPLRELLAVYSNVSPSIFCNFLQTLAPPLGPGLSQVNNNQSMFRIRFRIFSVPYLAEMSVRNPTPPLAPAHNNINPRPSSRNLSNPSFSSNLSNLCQYVSPALAPPSKLGSSLLKLNLNTLSEGRGRRWRNANVCVRLRL